MLRQMPVSSSVMRQSLFASVSSSTSLPPPDTTQSAKVDGRLFRKKSLMTLAL